MNQLGRGQAACAHALLELNTGFEINGLVFEDRSENGPIELRICLIVSTCKCKGRNRERAKQTKLEFHDVLPWLIKRSS
ncbi:Unknown protein sequence [Pseudomonas syringae pv. spinaceae]|uniref:Uncharacterized protein n=1 Tax=Pseudomonas syringae pv. spinaceae TaxID=264459 RepID=A0A0Q0AHJ7_PSESX|nr:Unknown protein sequence [Pseudomonas syringae pv. spinaceae]